MKYAFKMMAVVLALGIIILGGCNPSHIRDGSKLAVKLVNSFDTNTIYKPKSTKSISGENLNSANKNFVASKTPKKINEDLRVFSTHRLCPTATIKTPIKEEYKWDYRSVYSTDAVIEAKRRGLDCGVKQKKRTIVASIPKVKKPSISLINKPDSDKFICTYAVSSYDNSKWSSVAREYVDEAKRRGLDCRISDKTKTTQNDKIYDNSPLWLDEYNDFGKITVKIDKEVFKTIAATKMIKESKKIRYVAKVIIYNELCTFKTILFVGNKKGIFTGICPSGYEVKGSYIPLGFRKGAIGKGTDNLGNIVQYNFHSKAKGKSSKAEMILALGALNKTKYLKADKIKPIINAFTKQKGSNATISGSVTDNTEVAEVLIDGEQLSLTNNGTFKTKLYIPRNGLNVEIVAYDTKGNKASKFMKLERSNIQQANVQQFKRLNPSLKTVKSNPNTLALIIGISDYENTKASALYADSDAKTFYDYATMKLGIPSPNIKELINDGADRIDITRAIKTWLLKRTVTDKTDIYVFFAGHGLATDDGKGMYLLPYDGVPDLLEDSAIRRKELFADIQATKPRSVTVFLDTCYSGGTRNEETLVASLRPVLITAKEQSVPANFTVLSAAQGNQTSQSLEEAKHGLFSYYMMLGMEGGADLNADNKITAHELYEYVVDKVERQSQFRQTPELQGNKDRVLVQFN